jgi:putative membrane protein
MLRRLKEYFSGFLVGAADIVPGVSGGTMLFLLGLSERTFGAISKISPKSIAALLRRLFGKTGENQDCGRIKGFLADASSLEITYLARLACGDITAIILLSGVIKFLLEKQFSNAYAFFFGLIVTSTVFAAKMITVRKPLFVAHFLIGAIITVGITSYVDPSASVRQKSDNYKAIYEANAATNQNGDGSIAADSKPAAQSARLKYTGHYTAGEMAAAAAAGAGAISVMILPGLSGSLVLILTGQYYEILSAVSKLKTLQLDYFVFLSIVAMGMAIGVSISSRIVKHLFKRFYNGTIAVMVGLTAGSLYAIWPFKEALVIDRYVKEAGGITVIKDAVIHTNVNIIPSEATSIALSIIFCALGAGLMLILDRYARRGGGKPEAVGRRL